MDANQHKWSAERALDLIESERISAFSGPPSMLWDLVRARHQDRDISSLRSIGIAGQGLQSRLLAVATKAFPHIVFGQGYGMTETNGPICLIIGQELKQRPTSSGRIIATADIKIIDTQGAKVTTGDIGEISIRGAMLMSGYCKRPIDTANVLRDGWLFTGDQGRLDADGYLHIVDRKKDIIISGGNKISCLEVENIAMTHPAVSDAALFSVPHDRLGEIAVLAVVVELGHSIAAYILKKYIAAQLSTHKVPRSVMYCSVLPRNFLGKISRLELQRRHAELQQRNV